MKLDPMANEEQDGYIPTVDVIRLVRANFDDKYIRRHVERVSHARKAETFGTCADVALTYEDEQDRAVAVEIACRELLDAQRWLLPAL